MLTFLEPTGILVTPEKISSARNIFSTATKNGNFKNIFSKLQSMQVLPEPQKLNLFLGSSSLRLYSLVFPNSFELIFVERLAQGEKNAFRYKISRTLFFLKKRLLFSSFFFSFLSVFSRILVKLCLNTDVI